KTWFGRPAPRATALGILGPKAAERRAITPGARRRHFGKDRRARCAGHSDALGRRPYNVAANGTRPGGAGAMAKAITRRSLRPSAASPFEKLTDLTGSPRPTGSVILLYASKF